MDKIKATWFQTRVEKRDKVIGSTGLGRQEDFSVDVHTLLAAVVPTTEMWGGLGGRRGVAEDIRPGKAGKGRRKKTICHASLKPAFPLAGERVLPVPGFTLACSWLKRK